MRKLLSVLAAILLTGCASIADAGSLADVAVINRTTGERLQVYRHGARMYVEGRAGERYSVELRNRRASSMPSETISIYYDSRQNLIALGIIPRQAKLPQPFPDGGFVPDPS